MVARKEPRKKSTVYPRLTESCQSSTSLTQKREPCWATACWTGLRAEEEDTRGEDAGETSKTPTGTEQELWLYKTSATSKRHSACSSGNCLSRVGEGDRPGLQDRSAVPVGGDTVSPRSSEAYLVRLFDDANLCAIHASESPSCRRTSCWQDESGVSIRRVPPPKTNISVLFRTTPILQEE